MKLASVARSSLLYLQAVLSSAHVVGSPAAENAPVLDVSEIAAPPSQDGGLLGPQELRSRYRKVRGRIAESTGLSLYEVSHETVDKMFSLLEHGFFARCHELGIIDRMDNTDRMEEILRMCPADFREAHGHIGAQLEAESSRMRGELEDLEDRYRSAHKMLSLGRARKLEADEYEARLAHLGECFRRRSGLKRESGRIEGKLKAFGALARQLRKLLRRDEVLRMLEEYEGLCARLMQHPAFVESESSSVGSSCSEERAASCRRSPPQP